MDAGEHDWLGSPFRVSTLEVDAWIRIAPDFYFGPDRDFLRPGQREPIGVPLPAEDSYLSVEVALAHLDAVIEHHRRLFAIARRHGRPIGPGAPEVWLRPLVIGDGQISIFFPWTDTYQETVAVLTSLSADREGDLYWDQDQSWECVGHRRAGDLILGERNWEIDEPGRVLVVEHERFVAAAHAARTRLDLLLTRLTETLGENPWGFG